MAERRRHLKCKFGGTFETRACWSCAEAETGLPSPYQVEALWHGGSEDEGTAIPSGEVREAGEALTCVPPPLDGVQNLPRIYSGAHRIELSFNDQQWTQQLTCTNN